MYRFGIQGQGIEERMRKQMEIKNIYNCFGKFGCKGEEQKVGSWNSFFVFLKVGETLATYKISWEIFSRERRLTTLKRKQS